MRNELRRFETCAIFLQQVLKLFFWLKRQVGYWVIFQADWFMWMFSKSSQYHHNQWEGRGLWVMTNNESKKALLCPIPFNCPISKPSLFHDLE
jgi:hypothetical protein